jgi:hypothetical protein
VKGEIREMYHALLAFNRVNVVPMVKWKFERAGFLFDFDNFRSPVQSRLEFSLELPFLTLFQMIHALVPIESKRTLKISMPPPIWGQLPN